MTANFDELTDFYAKSYEWIFDNLKVILGLITFLFGMIQQSVLMARPIKILLGNLTEIK